MNNGGELILHRKSFRQLTTDELYELLRVRSEVFVVEQNCVYQDLDGDDQKAIHLWLMLGDKIVAYETAHLVETQHTRVTPFQ